MRGGYGDTSIDAILERSGGSKATLYSYFPTKEELFRAVIDSVVSNRQWPELDAEADVREGLVKFAAERMDVVFSERHRALLRLIIGERERFPDIARMYFEQGPRDGRDSLASHLADLDGRGLLKIGNAERAAEFFTGMLFHHWYTVLLYLNAPPPSAAEIRARAEEVVERFMRAYA